ncbi:heme ABC transporter ATP-binding protein [Shimia sp. Alg240-R146]|uniref:heme ABC transporter ATP-binding protein n=1 Tax=Shimia sp. Alg240-R146 TaxID=2993449 RepID=UPI0022E914DC|nr:heme ABC transporter ATP-binding protein [Shimia sp. Alg240-R146]
MLRAENITVHFGPRTVLHDVSFDAKPGALTAIVGPNGSGKTTLLKAITGEASHDGQVMLNGQNAGSAKPWELAAIRGVLPQTTPLAFPFTVSEVVRLGLISGVTADQAEIIPAALSRVGLADYGARFYQELSGGEQQRVQLARVLAQVWEPISEVGPRWLFLDEPVSALDIAHQLQVMQIARDFADAGGGVVAVMHDLNLTAMFADQIALISDGRIIAQSTPDEILTNDLLSRAYNCAVQVNTPPSSGTYILPHMASMGVH